MATETKDVQPKVAAPVVVSEKQLMADLQKALDAKDFKLVAIKSAELVKFQKTQEQQAAEAKQKALVAITGEVKAAFDKVVADLIKAKKLDAADGVWYSNDFAEKSSGCKLTKAAAKASGHTGGGTGKKFAVSTNELLQKYGGQEFKDGQTYQQVWDSSTDKNSRFTVRENLLKLEGLK